MEVYEMYKTNDLSQDLPDFLPGGEERCDIIPVLVARAFMISKQTIHQ